MKMRVVYLVGAAGAVKAPDHLRLQPREIPMIYREVDPEYRYAVGWNDEGELMVFDIYLTNITSEKPFLNPHFVERFEDIDQAVAALTIGYNMGEHFSLMDKRTRNNLLDNHSIDAFLYGVGGHESMAGLTPFIGGPRRR